MRPLRYVLAASEQTSFSAAADALGIKVSSVSRRVRNFEDAIGISLFERTPSGVRLTDGGRRFLDDIVPVLQMAEAILQRAGAAGRVEEGTVRVGIITTLAGCEVEEFWHERVHVAIDIRHPLAASNSLDWSQLREEHFIVSALEPGPEVHDYIVRRVADYSSYPDVAYHHVTEETLMHMVAIGEGITLVSEGWTSMVYPDLVLCPLTAREDIVPFSAVWSPASDNPALRRFLSFARELAARRRARRNQ